MMKWQDVVTSRGLAIIGAQVTVTNYPAGTPAVIYSDNGVTLYPSNVLTTDNNGRYFFFAANGYYSLSISGTNLVTQTITDILLQDLVTGGTGSVTTVSVAAVNGFGGTVATPTTTPVITLTTGVTGLLKGNAIGVVAAINSDLPVMSATVGGAVPTPPNNTTTFLRGDGTFAVASGSGNVSAGGTLTNNSMVLGAGTTTVQTVAGLTSDGVARYIGGVSTSQAGTVQLFGGTSGSSIITPPLIAGASTIITLPNATSTLPIFTQQITFAGPTAARTVTLPDAAITVARTDAANTFTGASTGTSWTLTTPVIAGGLTASGAGSVDFSGSTATFKTSTGANTFAAAVTIAGPAATTALTLTQTARTSGILPYIKYTIPTDTAQTAATESPGIVGITGTRTWATTGTVALQREIFFPGPTYASASASQTFTDAFNMYLTPPIAGTNAIFTRGHTLGIVDATSAASSITGAVVIATTLGTAATSVGIGGGNINIGGTFTGRITPRSSTTAAPGATPSINTDNLDFVEFTGVATAITSMTTNLTGTPVRGDGLIITFTDNATPQTITWGAKFEASTVALPTTTVTSTKLTVGFIWNTVTSAWRVAGVS